ncbi:MAG: hypothetical protein K0U19_04230 [Proteobacteria bacterium]|nr:hypothetical protein [Pseudomonadota bacterium]
MYNNKRFIILLIFSSLLLSILGIFAVNAMSDLNDETQSSIKFFQYKNTLGAGGYDVVAYFEDNAAVEGENIYEANFAGMLWNFASAENRDKFLATPDRYLPEYGGHCAYGVAQGYLVRGDPQAWSIRDNKLYFNYNKNIRNAWIADAGRFLRKSENNWPQLNK